MAFVRNNIRYRSAASKALEGYYNSKAFILNELIGESNAFSETAKEIMLLLFNEHATWLAYVEQLLLDKNVVSEHDVRAMLTELEKEFAEINAIFYSNPEIFDPEFVGHWTHIHKQIKLSLDASIRSVKGMAQMLAFPYVTENLVEYLNTTLFELYELDCLLGSDLVERPASTNQSHANKLMLYIGDPSLRYRSLTGESPELERYCYYRDNVIAKNCEFTVEVRNYTDQPEGAGPLATMCDTLITTLTGQPNVVQVDVVARSGRA